MQVIECNTCYINICDASLITIYLTISEHKPTQLLNIHLPVIPQSCIDHSQYFSLSGNT